MVIRPRTCGLFLQLQNNPPDKEGQLRNEFTVSCDSSCRGSPTNRCQRLDRADHGQKPNFSPQGHMVHHPRLRQELYTLDRSIESRALLSLLPSLGLSSPHRCNPEHQRRKDHHLGHRRETHSEPREKRHQRGITPPSEAVHSHPFRTNTDRQSSS